MILAIDFGFGNVKAISDTYHRHIFKSAFIKDNGNDRWLCGDDALMHHGVMQPTTIESMIELYPVTIAECMRRFDTARLDAIAVGLPLESAEYLSAQLQDTLSRQYNTRVFVYPQAASIAWLVSAKEVLIIDIGFNTVITCVVQNKKLTYAKTAYNRGAVSIARRLEKDIRFQLALTGKSFSTIELDYILSQGRVQNGLDVFDVRERAESLKREYIYETVKTAIQDLKVNLSSIVSFDSIIIAGGLAKDVKIDSSRIEIIPLGNPIFANAHAFLTRAIQEIGA